MTEDENYEQIKNKILTMMMQNQNAMMQNQNKLLESLIARLKLLMIFHKQNDRNRLQDKKVRLQNQSQSNTNSA